MDLLTALHCEIFIYGSQCLLLLLSCPLAMHQTGKSAACSMFGNSAAHCKYLSLLVRQVETVVGSNDGDLVERSCRHMEMNIRVKNLPHIVLSMQTDKPLLVKFAKGVVLSAAHLFFPPLLHFVLQLIEPSPSAAINHLLLSNWQTMCGTNQLLLSSSSFCLSSSSTFPFPLPPPGNEPQAEAQIERVSTLSMVRRDTALLLRDFRQGASNWIHSLLDSNRAPASAGAAAEPPPGSTGTTLLHNAHTHTPPHSSLGVRLRRYAINCVLTAPCGSVYLNGMFAAHVFPHLFSFPLLSSLRRSSFSPKVPFVRRWSTQLSPRLAASLHS